MDILRSFRRMSGLVWCCCSAGRADLLVKKTLATLSRGNFSGSLYVVVPSDEMVTYQRALQGAPVHTILLHCARGLTRQRRFFREQMPEHVPILFIDDDVEAIKVKSANGTLQHSRDVNLLGLHMIQMILASGDGLMCGVYPVANKMWMSGTVSQNNCYVVGAFYAILNDPRLREPEEDELEDYYRQLSEQAAGRPVLRLNYVGIQTQYFKNAGGLQVTRSPEKRLAAVQRLAAEFSSLVKIKTRKDGTPDLKFLAKAQPFDVPETAAPSPSADQSTDAAAPDVSSALCDLSGPAP